MAEVEKNNLVSTIQSEIEKFDYNSLIAKEENVQDIKAVESGNMMFKDLNRTVFVINGKPVGPDLTNMLHAGATDLSFNYKKVEEKSKEEVIFYCIGLSNKHLLSPSEKKDQNYRPFLVEAFKGMFEHAKAEVPSDAIIQELITNCNQCGYTRAMVPILPMLYDPCGELNLVPTSIQNTVYIDCNEPNCVKLKIEIKIPIVNQKNSNEVVTSLSGSLEFKLQSQENEEVKYTDGKLSLTLPKELAEDKGLLSKIMDAIKDLLRAFGIEIKNNNLIEYDFDKPNGKMDDVENVDEIQNGNSNNIGMYARAIQSI